MEKRRLTSLRSVLLQYLVRTALACLLVAVGWLLALMLWIQNGGLFLPANQAAQACQKAAQDVLPGMTAATFDACHPAGSGRSSTLPRSMSS